MTWAARRRRPAVAALAAAGGAAVAGSAASYLYSTGPGKRAIWAQLLDDLGLRGDEHVLDVGCGRGAVLMLAAARVPAGRAVGVDLCRRRDQSGNSRAAAERNAVAEGVRDQVELADADARDLPFASASLDVVVSSLAISDIQEDGGRAQALREAVRVRARRAAAHRRPGRGPLGRVLRTPGLHRRGRATARLADLVRPARPSHPLGRRRRATRLTPARRGYLRTYPPFCIETIPSVRFVGGAQNGISVALAIFWRMRGEVQRAGTVAPGHETYGSGLPDRPRRPRAGGPPS